MSGRRRSRRARGDARDRWPFLVGALLALGLGWWLFTDARSPIALTRGAAGAQPLAAHRPPDVHALAVAPTDERTLLFGHHYGMLVSRDGGASWSRVQGADGDAMGIAMPPGSATAYAAGHDVFYRSDDGGATWRSMRPALPGTDIHGLAAGATRPGTFYTYVVGHGLYVTEDGGVRWRSAGNAPRSTMSLACARSGDADVLFAATMEGVTRSRDGGTTWEQVPDLRGAASVSANGAAVFAAAASVVFASSDGGATWERRAFPRGGAVLVAVAPRDAKLLYVVTKRLEVWRSADAGASWERVG